MGTPVGCIHSGYTNGSAESAWGSNDKTLTILQILDGIVPPIELRVKTIAFKLTDNSPSRLGNAPFSKFFLASITLAFVRKPNDNGREPVKLFTFKARLYNSLNFPIDLGIDPDIKFALS